LLNNYEELHRSNDSGRELKTVRDADKSSYDPGCVGEEDSSSNPARSGAEKARDATETWNKLRGLDENSFPTKSAFDVMTHVHAKGVLEKMYDAGAIADEAVADENADQRASEIPDPTPFAPVAPVSFGSMEALEKAVRLKTYGMQNPTSDAAPPCPTVDALSSLAQIDARVYTREDLGLDVSDAIDETLRSCGPHGGPLDLEQARAVAIILHAFERRLSGDLRPHAPLRLKVVGRCE